MSQCLVLSHHYIKKSDDLLSRDIPKFWRVLGCLRLKPFNHTCFKLFWFIFQFWNMKMCLCTFVGFAAPVKAPLSNGMQSVLNLSDQT